MRDHGGNLDAAIATYGGDVADWVDLSTGINPRPYALPDLSANAWAALPTSSELNALKDAARHAYRTEASVLPLAGASAAIQLVPLLTEPGQARILGPTYNEHAAALSALGWSVKAVQTMEGLAGADLAVIVNPNNPDGRRFLPQELMEIKASVGTLVVDESFADGWPDLSLAPHIHPWSKGIVVMRSFGKFYGLAGLRLGFVLGGQEISRMAELAGPWPVSGPAIEVGKAALADDDWQRKTFNRLSKDAQRLDELARHAGWSVEGGTELFRLYRAANAGMAQQALASARIWSRTFPYSDKWIRLGLPDGAQHWAQVEECFSNLQND